MTTIEKAYEMVRNYIDDIAAHLSHKDYPDFLSMLIAELEAREEAAQYESEENEKV